MPRRPWLTTKAHEVFASAYDLADRLGHDGVTPVHIALAFFREHPNVATGALFHLGVPLDVLERELQEHLPPPGTQRPPSPERAWTPSDERIIDQAKIAARDLGTEHYGCEHLLLAFLRDEMGATTQVLARHGVRFDDLRTEILRIYNAGPE
ncbi:MAG: hypothetical protein OER90_16815 [Gemmatimonadota bacterium]|nr:hypothetical protein [Gemmatimonadota bacterium]